MPVMEVVQDASSVLNSLAKNGGEIDTCALKDYLLSLTVAIKCERSQRDKRIFEIVDTVFKFCCKSYVLHESFDLSSALQNILSALVWVLTENSSLIELKFASSEADDLVPFLLDLYKENLAVVNCMETLLTHLISRNVQLKFIKTVPSDIAAVLSLSFKYFSDSKNTYGPLVLSHVEETLKLLRKACCSLHSHFVTLISKTLNFNCNYEDELQLLQGVMNTMISTGQHLAAVDIKTMAEHWKTFMHVSELYIDHLKQNVNISMAVRYIATQVTEDLNYIFDTSLKGVVIEEKFIIGTLKIDYFLLRILLKMCEMYIEFLDGCYSELLDLIVTLHRYSMGCLRHMKMNLDIAEKINSYASTAVDPLLKVLVQDRAFAKECISTLTSKCCCTGSDAVSKNLAVLASLSTMLRIILSSETCVIDLWTHQCDSQFIDTIFETVSKCEDTLHCDDVHFSLMQNGMPVEFELYDALLVYSVSFLLCIIRSEAQLSRLEISLVKHVIHAGPVAGLFFADLWCTLARYTNENTRSKYAVVLIQLLRNCTFTDLKKRRVLHLRYTLSRIFSFLSPAKKEQLYNEHQIDRSIFLLYILHDQLTEKLLNQKIPLMHERQLMNLVKGYGMLGFLYMTKIGKRFDAYELPDIRFFHGFVSSGAGDCQKVAWPICIFSKSYFEHVNYCDRNELLFVLKKMKNYTRMHSLIRLALIDFLRCFAHYNFSSNVDNLTQEVGLLFRALLNDSNPLVHQHCLETFVFVAQMVKHSNVVSIAIPPHSKLSETVTNYLQKKLPANSSFKYCSFVSDMSKNFIKRILRDSDSQESSQAVCRKKQKLNESKDGENVISESKYEILSQTAQMLDNVYSLCLKVPPQQSEQQIILQIINKTEKLKSFLT